MIAAALANLEAHRIVTGTVAAFTGLAAILTVLTFCECSA